MDSNMVGDYRLPPVTDSPGAWAEDTVDDGQNMARFTVVRTWHSVGHAPVWYEKVSKDVWRDRYYERCGKGIDALRMIVEKEGMESAFLRVEGLAKEKQRFVFSNSGN